MSNYSTVADGREVLNLLSSRGSGSLQFLENNNVDIDSYLDGAVDESAVTYYPFSNDDLRGLATGAGTVVMQDVRPQVPSLVERSLEENGIPYERTRDSMSSSYEVYAVGTPQTVNVYSGEEHGDVLEHTPGEVRDGYDTLFWRPGLSLDGELLEAARDRAFEYLEGERVIHGNEEEITEILG